QDLVVADGRPEPVVLLAAADAAVLGAQPPELFVRAREGLAGAHGVEVVVAPPGVFGPARRSRSADAHAAAPFVLAGSAAPPCRAVTETGTEVSPISGIFANPYGPRVVIDSVAASVSSSAMRSSIRARG